MALDGDEDHDDQARSKAMLETAFQIDAFERVPKRVPNQRQVRRPWYLAVAKPHLRKLGCYL